MYYCTIYVQPKGRLIDKSLFEVFISLAYTDKADAESYKKNLVQQVVNAGGNIYLEEDTYTTVMGNIIIKSTGIFSNRGKNHYRIGIETETTKFSVLPLKARASIPIYKVTDGLAYEIRVEEVKQRKLDDLKTKQDEATRNLAKFKAEMKTTTEASLVLKSFVKYYNQRADKDKLVAIALKKIQELSET